MVKYLAALALALCLLTGCAPLLERSYTTVEPHSSRFWESGSADTLRAENYQDVVNDLLMLIGQHTENAVLRLYGVWEDLEVSELLERAAAEIQQETPLGAYAVEYITSSLQSQRGYYEAVIQIGYRRTAEQIQALVNATSPEAVYSLLEAALDAVKTEMAVRISYWGADGFERVEETVAQLRQERGLEDTPMWRVNYYPAGGSVGLAEFLLDPPPEEEPGEEPDEEPGGEPGGNPDAPPEEAEEPDGEGDETLPPEEGPKEEPEDLEKEA